MLITEVPMATAITGGLMDADLWCRVVREHRRLRAPHQLRVRMRRLPWIDLQRQPPGEERRQDLTKWGWPTPTEVPTAAIG